GVMGVSDLGQFSIGIYPNPNNGQFYVKAANVSSGNIKTTIYDTTGKSVFNQTKNHFGGNYQQAYQLRLPVGIYMIVIESADGITTDKLIIK
ncbi:MAG: T9SS type A sorting domain-containing protein, partial [Weeksellaceae bacterium]|nr:T9SS type A sorting domain-containing protein [Weeksellaceae bacterium]